MGRMSNRASVRHTGRVEKVDPGSVTVKIVSGAACSGCHAEGYCSLVGSVEKEILVKGSFRVAPGDTVTVMMEQAAGYSAVAIGYIIPFILLVTSLILLIALSVPEGYAGLISIGVLVPYYFMIYFFRNRIDRKFIFTIKK